MDGGGGPFRCIAKQNEGGGRTWRSRERVQTGSEGSDCLIRTKACVSNKDGQVNCVYVDKSRRVWLCGESLEQNCL